jgi:hypothetical protein
MAFSSFFFGSYLSGFTLTPGPSPFTARTSPGRGETDIHESDLTSWLLRSLRSHYTREIDLHANALAPFSLPRNEAQREKGRGMRVRAFAQHLS